MQSTCGVGAKIDLCASNMPKFDANETGSGVDEALVLGEGERQKESDHESVASSVQAYQDMQDLIDSWGSIAVSPQCVKDLNNFLQGQSEFVAGFNGEQGFHWIQQKMMSDESLSIRDLAVFVLLYNRSLLLLQHENNEAVSFDISQNLEMASSVRSRNQEKKEEDMANFERELEALCVEN
jgi:hypothetical protein|tara:strand:- start:2754 stop:3296 length:543 start_codon:yes stop_codon:yes gene_type:complete